MTYCVNKDCPFKDCDNHVIHIPKGQKEAWFANMDEVCERK